MYLKSMRKDIRALSPIFATLILISIAVIAGIVVYMFTSGTIATLTGGGSSAQEKVAVPTVMADATTNTLTVYAKSTGGGPVVIDGAILKDSTGATVEVAAAAGQLTSDGALVPISVALLTDISSGETYTVTLTSQGGGSFVSSSFKVP